MIIEPLGVDDLSTVGLRLDPRVHGRGRVPGPKTTAFDLLTFGQALQDRDIDFQVSQYAVDAELRIVDPDNPPSAPHLIRGRPAIDAWLRDARTHDVGLRVTHLVDGGDRVAFTETWRRRGGMAVVATSTAKIEAAMISVRHTIVVWDPS